MEPSEFLDKLVFPAFLVQDGQIIHANIAALERNVAIGSCIADIISVGNQEYQVFTQGKLCLTLKINEMTYHANVSVLENAHLFSLETEYSNPQLRVLALAAEQLRGPLSNAFAGTELLSDTIPADSETKEHLAQVNHSLYQLLRMVSNMSDTVLYHAEQMRNLETIEMVSKFEEILEKASALSEKAKKHITFTLPNNKVFSMSDIQKLERGILNMLSNALRYSPANSEISAKLSVMNNRLFFTVENPLSQAFSNEPFFRYLREPALTWGQSGIGLGLSIIRSVATAHEGTVLMELTDQNTVRFTMTIAIREKNTTMLRSPILLPTDYAGGKDRTLLELSDILPYQLYSDMD